ncbi:MAG: hypothetical protein J3Q66DRAFT_5381 [Benniella sp.]|nr:MAG: hypothetical protein J3Q66DRAFT_5381 [Benniella sp.]
MLRFSRRPSDTCGFLVLYWFTVLILLAGLGLFAAERITMIADRSFIIQENVETAEPKAGYFEVELPDFVFCTYVAKALSIDKRYTIETIELSDVPEGQMVKTPCWNSIQSTPYKSMHVLRSKTRYINALAAGEDPRMRFTFDAEFSETDWNRAALYVLPRTKMDEYYPRKVVDKYEMSPDPELEQNMHYLSEGEVNAYISASIEKIRVLYGGFLGYFNVHDDLLTEYKAVSSVVLAYEEHRTAIGVLVPLTRTTRSQILTVSIHGAIASFGGVLSIISAGLIIFFGSKRVTPFGIVQKWFMRGSTRQNIMKAYGNWEDAEDLLDGFLDKRDKDSSNFIDEKRETDFSMDMDDEKPEKDRSRDIQETSEKDPSGDIQENQDKDRSRDTQEKPTEEKGRSRDTQVQQASAGSPPPPAAKRNTQVRQTPARPPRQPSHNEEVISLRRQVQAQEIRVREMETLLKTYYLDMDLASPRKGRSDNNDNKKEQRASRLETMVEIGDALQELSS